MTQIPLLSGRARLWHGWAHAAGSRLPRPLAPGVWGGRGRPRCCQDGWVGGTAPQSHTAATGRLLLLRAPGGSLAAPSVAPPPLLRCRFHRSWRPLHRARGGGRRPSGCTSHATRPPAARVVGRASGAIKRVELPVGCGQSRGGGLVRRAACRLPAHCCGWISKASWRALSSCTDFAGKREGTLL